MNFTDETTVSRIGLDKIMQQLRTLSPYGKTMKKKMPTFPPGCEAQVQAQWHLVESLLGAWSEQTDKLQDIELILNTFRDVRGIVRKACHDYVLEDVELFEIKRFLELTIRLTGKIDNLGWQIPGRLKIPLVTDLYDILAAGGGGGFYLDDAFAPGLGELRDQQRHLKSQLSQLSKELQEAIAREAGLAFNHQGRLRVSKLEGRLLERLAKRSDLILAAENYTEVEYVLRDNEKMAELSARINEYEARIDALEYGARKKLTSRVAARARLLFPACRRLGNLDLLLAKARLAREIGWCVPELIEANRVELAGFVNPLVSDYLAQQGLSFQPVSLNLSTPVTVITGANMGGKSVSLKSMGLAVAMAQKGLLVPAKSFKLSLRSFIFYSQQDEDPGQGLSTFGAEVQCLAGVLPRRFQRGLYLLDEPARGTNPWEGSALVKAMAIWLGEGNSLTLVATHFPGLSKVPGISHFQVAGLASADSDKFPDLESVGLDSLNKLMDFSLMPGSGDIPRDALKVAAFLGLAPEILARATQELGLLTQEVE